MKKLLYFLLSAFALNTCSSYEKKQKTSLANEITKEISLKNEFDFALAQKFGSLKMELMNWYGSAAIM